MTDPLVTTDWLAERLSAPDLVVLDATYYLPHEGKDARSLFAQARIPGARFFDIDAFADAEEPDLPHMVPSAARFARMIGALGIGNGTMVVAYDQRGIFSAGRAWWLLGLFGHDRVAVLDGGLPKWLAEGRPAEAGPAPEPEAATFRPDLRAARWRGIGDMIENLSSRAEQVVDARAAPRFAASVPEPRPGVRAGHIPGAVNVPFASLLAPDGTMLPAETLRGALASAGVDGSRPVVTYCGSGVTATVVTLAMVRAGLPRGAIYDGSWSEWGGRADTPVEPG